MNELFQKIADSITDSSIPKWKRAELLIRVHGSMVRFKLYFINDDGSKTSEFLEDNDGSLSKLLRKYHLEMNESNPKHWNKLLFKLDSSGKFETEFEWDQALQDEYEKNSRL